MFDIPAGDFIFAMAPVACVPDDEGDRRRDWITVRMTAEVPGIRAEKEWMLMRVEFDGLQKRLTDMHEAIAAGRPPADVSFQSLEGVLELGLRIIDLRLGSIHLDFIIRPEPASGFSFSGSAIIDQSFLPGLAMGLETLAGFGLDA